VSRVFLAILIAYSAAHAQRPAVEEAWELLAKGKREQAVTLLGEIIRRNSADADARLLLGSILADGGDHAGALVHLRQAVKLRPNYAEARNALGESLNALGDTRSARETFQRAVELAPNHARARENLGLTLLQDGMFAEAGQQLDDAIRLLGDSEPAAYTRYLRAKVHAEQNEPKKAAAELNRALALRPDFAEAWSDLGQARLTLGDDAGALAAFERSVRLNPEGAVALTRLGSLYLQFGRARDAVPHLEKAARLDAENQTALYNLQRALRENGQVERAAQIKTQLTELFRKRDRASQDALVAVRLNNEGASLEKKGNLRAAVEKYRTAVDKNPKHAGIRVNLAVALLRLGRWQEGIAELREAVRQDPTNERFRRALEDALAQAPAAAKQ